MARLASDEQQQLVEALKERAGRLQREQWASQTPGRTTEAETRCWALASRVLHARRVELVGGMQEPPLAITPGRELVCQMTNACAGAVTHIDDKGFVYCTAHATVRRGVRRCRLLRASERTALEQGEALPGYGGSR